MSHRRLRARGRAGLSLAVVSLAGLAIASLALVVAACGTPAPSLAPSPSAVAVVTPVPTQRPTPRPTPAPTATPTPEPEPTASVDGPTAIAAFVTFAQEISVPFHMDVTLRIGLLSRTVDMAMDIDAIGADMAGTMRMVSGSRRYDIDVVILDDREYARIDDGTWLEVPDAGAVENPWTTIPLELLEWQGIELIGGVPNHHLSIDDPSVANIANMESATITDVEIDSGRFDLYVTDDGLPTKARFAIRGSAIAGGVRTEIELDGVYLFSDIGTPVEIEAPF